ncbi:Cystathionine beta-synthase core [Penicillium paradoxum]|uniref:Cystathionine beta-synthase core n=1 Tax=Penicillium paradoxum TaxID=176176 RepID=UPI0025478182|nr:Cystathionine beta-synthase core [Penicillium paradoxum]KAJ5787995.1 Cystathionine beta-synthase core [Penicillium paradoxum]
MPLSLPKSGFASREQEDTETSHIARTAPPSPTTYRRSQSYLSETHTEYQSLDAPLEISETTRLLGSAQDVRRRAPRRSYTSTSGVSGTGPDSLRHLLAAGSLRRTRNHSRANSTGRRLSRRGSVDNDSRPASLPPSTKDNLTASSFLDERTWYDQFTSTDWVHDSIADGARLRLLRQRKDVRGRLLAAFDGAQGWILVALIGCITACIAYFVDVTEGAVFDLKEGFCTTKYFRNRRSCCEGLAVCDEWRPWSRIFSSDPGNQWIDLVMFIFWVVTLALISCALTLLTKTVVPSSISLATLDENLGADSRGTRSAIGLDDSDSPLSEVETSSPSYGTLPSFPSHPAMIYYSAAGSGVAEVKVINSGFVLHGYMGLKTLVVKTIGLIFSVSSGLSLGKEGPYVHIATCVGNICCRLFAKYNQNDGKRREVLSASAASGVAVAFGAPIGGVLFSLEEVSYYFPPKTLFRTFFCCIAATLTLKFLNPYGTGKIVLFEVRYLSDWEMFEMLIFVALGILGGAAGALFIKASSLWARSFRRIPVIKRWPMLEVFLVALITGLVSFWNRYTRLPVTELLFELATPCESDVESTGLCPRADGILDVIKYLLAAFVIKSFLTIITFGIKVPAGIYVPSMVVGGLMGRIVGHLIQYWALRHPTFFLFDSCPAGNGIESCVTPGVYALIAAGATMCGVTRLSVTLAVILFELTGSLNHVLPFSLSVLCAKWTADAIEPRSIYDLLTDMNSYPFLDSKLQPTSDAELGDIVRPVRKNRIIDISASPFLPATELRSKLEHLLMAGELDSGLPILRDGVLTGLIPAPDLEYALDTLGEEEENTICLMTMDASTAIYDSENEDAEQVDFSRFIDPAPIALDTHSPIDLVYQCFAKLGLRYLCVTRDGKYAGLVHKKSFVKFMKENSD